MFWDFHPHKGGEKAGGASGVLECALAVCPEVFTKRGGNITNSLIHDPEPGIFPRLCQRYRSGLGTACSVHSCEVVAAPIVQFFVGQLGALVLLEQFDGADMTLWRHRGVRGLLFLVWVIVLIKRLQGAAEGGQMSAPPLYRGAAALRPLTLWDDSVKKR